MVSSKNEMLSDVIHYYEVRMSALSEYSDRVWNRFNWFLTLQLAIFGFYFSQLDKITLFSFFKSGVPIIAIIVALLWVVMGVEDYISMRKHGKRKNEVEKHVNRLFKNQDIIFKFQAQKSFIRFRQTWLLFLFPILTAISWLAIHIIIGNQA